ncbi:MAG: NHLP bacteriocin system secretion protein, partial [Planctomycetota bacterium]|nr:NHLP bacteriocin system secretion protein [Planctomycetota bacterium]
IARTEAVTQLGSSEQLDQRLVVITASSWILLVVAGLLVVLAIAWGFFGRLPNKVEGEGVIAPQGTQPIEINSPSGVGGVVALIAPEYEEVEAGDPLVRLLSRDLEVRVANAKSQVDLIEKQNKKLTEAEDKILARQKSSLDAQLAAAKQTSDQTTRLSKLYETELEDLKQLVKDQLVPRSQLVQTQQAYFGVLQQITQQETIVAQANEQYFSLVTSTERQRLARASQLAEAQENLAVAQTNLEISTVVLAPVAGTVLEHAVDLGSAVGVGTTVTSIRPRADESADLTAMAYVPYGDGRRVRKGMEVRLTLPFVQPSRYGYILGEVISVSTFVSDNSASVHLGSQELAEKMAQQLGPMLELMVKLHRDESTPTGLKWTSGRGYDKPLAFPALCGVQVVVSEDRPIDLVLPWFKDLIGLDPQVKVLEASSG